MSLSREEAESHGLAFAREGDTTPADPDIEIYEADLTVGGHTEHFAGPTAESVIEQAERVLLAKGKIQAPEAEQAEYEVPETQSVDVKEPDDVGVSGGPTSPFPGSEADAGALASVPESEDWEARGERHAPYVEDNEPDVQENADEEEQQASRGEDVKERGDE